MKVRIFLAAALAVYFSKALLAGEPVVVKWHLDGVEREALVFAPSASADAKVPVVFAFHGHGGNMRFAARGMHFQDDWPEALVVYMQGLPTPSLHPERESKLRSGWQHNPGELNDRDLKFFDAVLATLREKYSIDDRRIYATGFSNGGFFTYLLWAQRPQIFAAFAPGAGLILPSFEVTAPRPAFHFGGELDSMVKFSDQQKTIATIRELNHCAPTPDPCGPKCSLFRSSTGNPVETFIYPGAHFYPPGVTIYIVKFFQQFERKS